MCAFSLVRALVFLSAAACPRPYDWRRQVHSVFNARECVKAHELMDSGEFTGKIVLSWSDE
jgi:hypothetical protein